ncbi:uncharacterized protein LOC142616617 [Castanea sativa]|uniref:uncharacterized protein LOC142616617 n=1 Tax=Castanea sativa TaxID=21020 RepID=UPI003F65225F
MHGFFEVRKYNGPHTCTESTLTQDHEQLDIHIIEKDLRDIVKDDPNIRISSLQQSLYNKYEYWPSYFKVWEAKQKAIGRAFGDWDKSYQLLPKRLKALTDSNPGSRVIWRTVPATVPYSKEPVISIDGTFLYGKYRGKLLIASTWDGDNRLFPLAFAIVDEESDDSWYWFLRCIQNNVTNRDELCVIYDRHPGIMSAIRVICESTRSHHRFCLRHVASNFNQKIGNKNLKAMVMWAGMENQLRKYQITRDRITQLNADGDKYLRKLPVHKWTLSHDGGHRYGAMTTTLSESFNAYFADQYTKARTEIAASECITAYAKNKFNKWEKKAPKHSVTVFSHEDGLFEVRTPINPYSAYRGNYRHEASLQCDISTATTVWKNKLLVMHLDFGMVPDSVHWNEPDFPVLYPNVNLRHANGRPRSTRLLNEMDLGTEHQPRPLCSLCMQEYHNRRTCPTRTVADSTSGQTE